MSTYGRVGESDASYSLGYTATGPDPAPTSRWRRVVPRSISSSEPCGLLIALKASGALLYSWPEVVGFAALLVVTVAAINVGLRWIHRG